jgi:SAM-dependent methyltransferase
MMAPEMVDVIEGRKFARTEHVNCPVCHESRTPREINVGFGMKASVAECGKCRIAFQTPRPSLDASMAYMNWRWASSDPYVANRDQQRKRAQQQMKYIEMVVDRPTSLLDFGAGAGGFVRAALDAGWRATGVERSESARSRAKELYGVDLLADLQGDKYDVVTMWDVIEHLRDPIEVVSSLRRVLAPGGFLIVETGNYENWLRLSEKDDWGLYLFDHQFYFSPKSLEKMLSAAGLSDCTLLDINHVRPPGLRTSMLSPGSAAVQWYYWLAARRKWPQHGDINIMIASARQPANISGAPH